MKQYKNVRGTQDKVANLEVNIDTVYSRNNIKRIETEDFNGWEYDELQYSLREYQESLGKMTSNLAVSRENIITDNNATAELVVISRNDIDNISEMLVMAFGEIEKLKSGGNIQ